MQPTHSPVRWQNGVSPSQSSSVAHCTHSLSVVQYGVLPVQPSWSVGSQSLHSADWASSTQTPSVPEQPKSPFGSQGAQRGPAEVSTQNVPALQLLGSARVHCWHAPATQFGCSLGQSAAALQSTTLCVGWVGSSSAAT